MPLNHNIIRFPYATKIKYLDRIHTTSFSGVEHTAINTAFGIGWCPTNIADFLERAVLSDTFTPYPDLEDLYTLLKDMQPAPITVTVNLTLRTASITINQNQFTISLPELAVLILNIK